MKHRVGLSLLLLATPLAAQTFTTAAEVKPILLATKPAWIAVREFDGRDLLYFTNLLAWRCGVSEVLYSVNGGEPVQLEMEPCHEDTAQPNALLMEGILPYVTLPLASVEKVTVAVLFDDGSSEAETYQRKSVLTP